MKQQNSSVKHLRSNKPLFASYSDITLEYLTKTKEEQDLYVFRGETEEGKYFILLVQKVELPGIRDMIRSKMLKTSIYSLNIGCSEREMNAEIGMKEVVLVENMPTIQQVGELFNWNIKELYEPEF